jgi:hypothetical protein
MTRSHAPGVLFPDATINEWKHLPNNNDHKQMIFYSVEYVIKPLNKRVWVQGKEYYKCFEGS